MAKKAKKATKKKAAPARARARKASPRPAATRKAAPKTAAPSAKQHYLNAMGREHKTTLKVMRAYPNHQGEFQPHGRSSTAKQLMWTFVIENELIRAALDGTLKMPPQFPPVPATLDEIIAAYENSVKHVTALVEKTPDTAFAKTVEFFTGPRQMGHVPINDVLWLMLNDSIHHRGQLSVYVRMAGGLVPSIYGPSADEPWN